MTLQADSQGQSFLVLSKRQLWEHEHGCGDLPLSILHILAMAVLSLAQEEGRLVSAFSGSTMELSS